MTERSSIAGYLQDFQSLGDECAYVQHRGYRTERWSYGRVAIAATGFAHHIAERGIEMATVEQRGSWCGVEDQHRELGGVRTGEEPNEQIRTRRVDGDTKPIDIDRAGRGVVMPGVDRAAQVAGLPTDREG